MQTAPLKRTAVGFTLIELMIVVAVLAVLAAIAMPNYQEYVRRSKRAQASTQLVSAANYMQRFYSANDRYDKDKNGNNVALPAPLSIAPADADASKAYYNISLSAVSATGFALKATRTGSMADDKCGNFELDHLGRKTISNANSGITSADCWR